MVKGKNNDKKMKSKVIEGLRKGDYSPKGGGSTTGRFKQYDEPVMYHTVVSEQDISDFLYDNIQELSLEKVEWEPTNYDNLLRRHSLVDREGNINEAGIDTITKITGAKLIDYDKLRFTEGYECIPVLVFNEKDVVKSVSHTQNLGAVSRDVHKLDEKRIKNKNMKFFPKHGMVTSYDKLNGLVQVNVNIIAVIIEALGFNVSEFGRPENKRKLFLQVNQDVDNSLFRVSIVNNKYYDKTIKEIIEIL